MADFQYYRADRHALPATSADDRHPSRFFVVDRRGGGGGRRAQTRTYRTEIFRLHPRAFGDFGGDRPDAGQYGPAGQTHRTIYGGSARTALRFGGDQYRGCREEGRRRNRLPAHAGSQDYS